ncbi:flagellin [Acuticoccus sp. I52.16.1]|uniref:flagellin N-terminal helical domain-containing protein n=1 Tax=Acuticoccus sp. I52.16.1 TaxID=2928472 RepID=UPI001FD1800C|nr:flagellin [Acuticoccus sp. I52.16.1]UOM34297.1 flagellin [Acuticoccus sp. I52.16.1]
MTSILTNAGAISALRNLQTVNASLEKTNERIGTGLRVNSAADNATYWKLATTARSENAIDEALRDSLGVGKALMGTVEATMEATVTELQDLQTLLTTARQAGTDRTSIQSEINGIVSRLVALAATEPMDGVTLFTEDPATNSDITYLTSVNHSATTSFGSITVDTDKFILTDDTTTNGILNPGATTINSLSGTTISALTDANAAATIDPYLGIVDGAIAAAISGAQEAGAALSALESAENYLNSMIDARTVAIGDLVDANMEQESTKLRALQTQQQLAIESLSIANSQSASILGLFR